MFVYLKKGKVDVVLAPPKSEGLVDRCDSSYSSWTHKHEILTRVGSNLPAQNCQFSMFLAIQWIQRTPTT